MTVEELIELAAEFRVKQAGQPAVLLVGRRGHRR
jgi:hypothetical protein